jgi:hypothetical protein
VQNKQNFSRTTPAATILTPGFGDQAGEIGLPEEKCNSQNQRMAVWFILNGTWESKMEIPV